MHSFFRSFIMCWFLSCVGFIMCWFLSYNIQHTTYSVIQQHKSTIIIHIPPPSWASLFSSHSTPLGHHRLCSLCYTATSHQLSILHMILHLYWCDFLHLSHSLPQSLCPQVNSLHLCLGFLFANRFINIVFIDSIYMY